ncbi:MAG: ATP-dependent DNA helicase UvrD2 [Actinomycetes bacterium]
MHLTTADDVLAALDPEQRQVALALSGPVCVLAGAGTGKTRALTHRIAYGALSGAYVPSHVLAVTFTARAAVEMRSRLRDLGVPAVQARTFHAAALRQLQYFWPRVVGGSLPRLVEHKAPLVAEAAARLRIRPDKAAVRDISAEIEWAKVSMLTPEGYPAAARRAGRAAPADIDIPTMSHLLQSYEDVKTDRGVIDFEDVLLLAVGILQEHAEVAEAVRHQYRHLVVDEYQDVSQLQQRLLDLWLGDREDVCVVGDPSQTIYSFAGASPEYLLQFPKRYPAATVVRLVRNYRSTPQVVTLANRMLQRAPQEATRARVELVAQRAAGPAAELAEYEDDETEALAVAQRARSLVQAGTPAAEIAILYRTNAQSQPFEQALADLGVGYQLRGGERFFARREVRDVLVLLRGAARSDDGSEPLGRTVRSVLAGGGWTEQPPSGVGAVRERWDSLNALAGLADQLQERRPGASVRDLVAELDERAQAQHAPTVDGVTLASLHAAKGLEWDVVFLVGLSEGLVPISFAETPREVAEERRLLYVGVTRARERVLLSWSASRTVGARGSRRPSRFLDGVPLEPGAARRPAQGAARGRRAKGEGLARTCRSCGAALSTPAQRKVGRCSSCPPTYEESTFHALREWRSGEAAEAKVPAYVVFTDATLVALAEARPGDRAALARVPGIGPAKLERYGDAVLALLSDAGEKELRSAAAQPAESETGQ